MNETDEAVEPRDQEEKRAQVERELLDQEELRSLRDAGKPRGEDPGVPDYVMRDFGSPEKGGPR